MPTSNHQAALQELGGRLEQHGFAFRSAAYFSDNGIVVYKRGRESLDDGNALRVLEGSVFLYRSSDGWRARVTRHGGPHWTKQADDVRALEGIAVEALHATQMPPSDAWVET